MPSQLTANLTIRISATNKCFFFHCIQPGKVPYFRHTPKSNTGSDRQRLRARDEVKTYKFAEDVPNWEVITCTAPVWNAPKTDSTLRPKPVYPFPERRVHIVYHTIISDFTPSTMTEWNVDYLFLGKPFVSKRFSVSGRFTHKIYFEPSTFRRVVRQKNRNVCALNRPCSMFAWISSTDRVHFPSKRRRSKYDFVWKPLAPPTSIRPVQIDNFP